MCNSSYLLIEVICHVGIWMLKKNVPINDVPECDVNIPKYTDNSHFHISDTDNDVNRELRNQAVQW